MSRSELQQSVNVCRLVAQDMENISEDDGWEFVNLGDQQSFGIKTAGLEEKATACQMLVSDQTVVFVDSLNAM